MARKAKRRRLRRERRGRPPSALARRRQTTVAGRHAAPDRGTPELRRQRRAATTSEDLPHDLPGALFGRGLLEREEYLALLELARLVRLVRLGFGLGEGSVAGAWRNILTAAHGGWGSTVPAGADRARATLARLRGELAPPVWAALADGVDELWPDDFERWLRHLRQGLAHLIRRLPGLARVKKRA